MENKWREKHFEVISDFLERLNKETDDYILKGGTSLMMCYHLDRFSEDIDLDSTNRRMIGDFVKWYCSYYDYSYRIAKDTPTVKRFMIYYGGVEKPLKVEISFRKKYTNRDEVSNINGINVYNINQLAIMKANAYTGRDKIRDFYDVCFICNNYWDELEDSVKSIITTALEYKGFEQYEYIIKDQKDILIDNDKLLDDFLNTCNKLGLLTNESVFQETEEEDLEIE